MLSTCLRGLLWCVLLSIVFSPSRLEVRPDYGMLLWNAKSGRVSLVTRLAAKGVPSGDGMKITGHKSVQGYERYDRTKESKINACMDMICQPQSQSFTEVLSDHIAKHGESSRNCLGEISSNIPSTIPSTILRVSDLPNASGKENTRDIDLVQANCPVGPVVEASPAVVPSNVSVVEDLISSAVLQSAVLQSAVLQSSASVQPLDPLVASSSAHLVEPPIQLVASNAPEVGLNDNGHQLVKKHSMKIAFENDDDDFDEAFYSELSEKYPDSAKALGRYVAPAISNQGTFNGCTFNFGLDPTLLLGAINAAINKGSSTNFGGPTMN